LRQLDQIYGIKHTSEEERKKAERFTQGDYRRFSALFYVHTRRLLQETVFLMEREKKKRMMMRHLLTSAGMIGLIPREFLQREVTIEKSKLEELAAQMTP